jgi:hypothetical protein
MTETITKARDGMSNDRSDRTCRWMIGSVSVLFLIGVGLELFVWQAFRQVSFATILLALSLASWSYVLGLGGLIFFSVWWLMKLWRVVTKRAALSRYSLVGSSSRHLEKAELQDSQYPQQGVASGESDANPIHPRVCLY